MSDRLEKAQLKRERRGKKRLIAELRQNRAKKPEKFGCVGCGACCRSVFHIPGVFEEPINPDGSCSHLTEDNMCDIYETRPRICRIDEYDLAALGLTKEVWHDANYQSCEELITIGRR